MTAPAGSVLGVDVGFSQKNKTSAACLLTWTETFVRWRVERFRAIPAERDATIKRVVGREKVVAAAFDGPLRRGLDRIGIYRTAERMLVRRLQPLIGKPGQSSAPVGIALNMAANECVRSTLSVASVGPSKHELAIHESAVVEAFPSSYMGVMLSDPSAVQTARSDRSDIYYSFLAQSGGLQALVNHLLPGRRIEQSFADLKNHDDRAGLICALSALCVANDDYCAVGDDNGWIVLPPRRLIRDWAWKMLSENAAEEAGGCLRTFNPSVGTMH